MILSNESQGYLNVRPLLPPPIGQYSSDQYSVNSNVII